MRKSVLPQIIIILVVVSACIAWSIYRYETDLDKFDQTKKLPINLGLDLKGGVHLVLKCLMTPGTEKDANALKELPQKVEGVMKVMQNRLDPNGVREISMQKQGDVWVNIDIPGEKDPEAVKKLVGKTALLQFVHMGKKDLKQGDKVDPEILKRKCPELYGPADYCVVLTGASLKKAQADYANGAPIVDFELTPEGGDIFFKHSRKNIHNYLAIVLDGTVVSCPVLNGAIKNKGIIEGRFTTEEVQELVTWLNSGALPMEVEIAEMRAVSPTLGKDSLQKSLIAGALGLMLVLIFMVGYYRMPGLIADCALLIYVVILFGVMSMFNATLTLPGIAGFILSIGMAVDANIIIFERMKEEIRWGKTLKAAVEAGFSRALPAILDSNAISIMTCVVLYILGSGPIRGFAVTLFLGVCISLFSAITISRTFLILLVDVKSMQNIALYGVKAKTAE